VDNGVLAVKDKGAVIDQYIDGENNVLRLAGGATVLTAVSENWKDPATIL